MRGESPSLRVAAHLTKVAGCFAKVLSHALLALVVELTHDQLAGSVAAVEGRPACTN